MPPYARRNSELGSEPMPCRCRTTSLLARSRLLAGRGLVRLGRRRRLLGLALQLLRDRHQFLDRCDRGLVRRLLLVGERDLDDPLDAAGTDDDGDADIEALL